MTAALAFLRGHRLAVYASRGCPDCSRLERWLRERGVAHDEVLIDAEPAAAERLERETGRQAVPYILVDDRAWVRGYHSEERSRLSEEKLVAELRAALAG